MRSWESIVATNKSKGFSGDDLYKKIIESSKTPLGDSDKMKLGDDIWNQLKLNSNSQELKTTLIKYRMWRY